MGFDQLIFVGLNGRVIALDRDTGRVVWENREMKSGYVTFVLDGDRLIVSTNGYLYCLHPLTGKILWHNPMKGYGMGVASLATIRGSSPQIAAHMAADQQARESFNHSHTIMNSGT